MNLRKMKFISYIYIILGMFVSNNCFIIFTDNVWLLDGTATISLPANKIHPLIKIERASSRGYLSLKICGSCYERRRESKGSI